MSTVRSLCFKGVVKLRVDLDLGIYEQGDLVFVEGIQRWFVCTEQGWIQCTAGDNVSRQCYEIGGSHGFKATHVNYRDLDMCIPFEQDNSTKNQSQIPL